MGVDFTSWEVDLVGVDLVGVDFVGVDFVGVDLVGMIQLITEKVRLEHFQLSCIQTHIIDSITTSKHPFAVSQINFIT